MSITANPIPGRALLSQSNRELRLPNEAVEAERDEVLPGLLELGTGRLRTASPQGRGRVAGHHCRQIVDRLAIGAWIVVISNSSDIPRNKPAGELAPQRTRMQHADQRYTDTRFYPSQSDEPRLDPDRFSVADGVRNQVDRRGQPADERSTDLAGRRRIQGADDSHHRCREDLFRSDVR